MTGLGSSCGACKFLRRRCTSECVFAPYFCYDQAASTFAAVHKVFGASNVSKLLLHLPVHVRCDAAVTISYEALARVQDPVYGCIAHIFALEQQVACLKEEIETIGKQMAKTSELQSPDYFGNAYFAAAQHGIANISNNQQNLPTQNLPTAFADETAWCSYMELQQCLETDLDEISQEHFDSSILERLFEFEEPNQEYYFHMIS